MGPCAGACGTSSQEREEHRIKQNGCALPKAATAASRSVNHTVEPSSIIQRHCAGNALPLTQPDAKVVGEKEATRREDEEDLSTTEKKIRSAKRAARSELSVTLGEW
jgi:hypothetical protein